MYNSVMKPRSGGGRVGDDVSFYTSSYKRIPKCSPKIHFNKIKNRNSLSVVCLCARNFIHTAKNWFQSRKVKCTVMTVNNIDLGPELQCLLRVKEDLN